MGMGRGRALKRGRWHPDRTGMVALGLSTDGTGRSALTVRRLTHGLLSALRDAERGGDNGCEARSVHPIVSLENEIQAAG